MISQSLLIDIRRRAAHLRDVFGVIGDMLQCGNPDAAQVEIARLGIYNTYIIGEVMRQPVAGYWFPHHRSGYDFSYKDDMPKVLMSQDDTDICLDYYYLNPDKYTNVYYSDASPVRYRGQLIASHDDRENIGRVIINILKKDRPNMAYSLECPAGGCHAGVTTSALTRLLSSARTTSLITLVGNIAAS